MSEKVVNVLKACNFPLGEQEEISLENICIRCVFRLFGVKDSSVYLLKTKCLVDAWEIFSQTCFANRITIQPPEQNGGKCSCCLGILSQLMDAESVLDNLQQILKLKNYTATNYTFATSLPSCTLVREFSINTFLQKNLKNYHIQITELKEVVKWLLCPPVSTNLNGAFYYPTSDLCISIAITHSETENESLKVIPDISQARKKRGRCKNGKVPTPLDGFGSVSRALAKLNSLPNDISCPPSLVVEDPMFVFTPERASFYIKGRYLKYQRGLSQTPWFIEGKRMGDSSVEECISNIVLPFFMGTSSKFHTAGREDVDVRMLGNGRPFILEIIAFLYVIDAKNINLPSTVYEKIQTDVNEKNKDCVAITNLEAGTKDNFVNLQSGAESKKKSYCCVVWVSKALDEGDIKKLQSISDLKIAQKTPVRVLHRRTLMTREKTIHNMQCEYINKHYMLLRLTTSAGAYVKEFVHGDLGRTMPNISSILNCKADILQLDVEKLIDDEK